MHTPEPATTPQTDPTAATPQPAPKVGVLGLLRETPGLARYGINGFIQSAIARHGDVVAATLGPTPAIFVAHPDHIRHILIKHKDNYSKESPLFKALRPLAGNGVFLSEGEFWRSQRRIVQPEFTRKGVDELVDDMAGVAAAVSTEWDMQRRREQTIDAGESMRQAAMRIICRTVLDVDVGQDAQPLGRALDRLMLLFQAQFSVPDPASSLFARASDGMQRRQIERLDRFIYSAIEQNSAQHTPGVVERLLAAPDPETGRRMSIQHLRDEIITLFIAGHETTATTLTWAWVLLCQHPEVMAAMQQELDRVLGGRLPTAADLRRLPLTRAVFDEALRLYPPLPFIVREAIEDDVLDGRRIPAGTTVVLSFFTTHRLPEFWDEPEAFKPERFLPENADQIVKHAYVPFGAGPRTCLGNHFAIAEGQVLLATLAQRFDVAMVNPRTVSPTRLPGSLRPSSTVKLKLTSRVN